MTCHSPWLAASTASAQAVSLSTDCRFAGDAQAGRRPAAEPFLRFWRGLVGRRPQLPRLALEELSPDRLRDLGLLDGRGVPPRDPRRGERRPALG